jgi:hypothetical protein
MTTNRRRFPADRVRTTRTGTYHVPQREAQPPEPKKALRIWYAAIKDHAKKTGQSEETVVRDFVGLANEIGALTATSLNGILVTLAIGMAFYGSMDRICAGAVARAAATEDEAIQFGLEMVETAITLANAPQMEKGVPDDAQG